MAIDAWLPAEQFASARNIRPANFRIVLRHALAISVEDATDVCVHAVVAMIGHRHGLGESLGFIIDSADADGIDMTPVVLALGMLFRIAVNFTRAGQEIPCTFELG